MTSHVTLSPSKRYQFAACPGSVREQAKFPDGDSGPAAIDGTHTHTLLDTCIKTGLPPDAFVGQTLKDHEGEFVVNEDRASRAKVAFDYVMSRREELGMATIIAESRVEPEWLIGRKDMGGTVDVQIRGSSVLEIIDYKDGMNDAWDSAIMQMEQYALGVLAGYKLPVNGDYPVQSIRLTVIQPKLAFKGIAAVRSKDYTVREILDMIPVLVREAAATDVPDALLVPGESQCKYCRAKGSCSALASNVMKEVGIMFQPVVTQTLDVAQQSADKDPTTMSDEQLRQIMEAAPLMRQLLDGVEKESLRRLKAGQAVPGLKLVYGKGSREWSLSEEEMADRLIKMGIPKSAVWETKLVTPAKAEKLTWEKTKAGEKVKVQLTERQLKTLEQEYVTKLAGKLTIVPESDSRPAVVLNAAPMFSAVEEVPALPDWLK